MRAVIIEDEKLAAEDLRRTLESLEQEVQVVKVLGSVQEAICYFREFPDPDLIFSDIELGDGKCFEIFRQVDLRAPVVFSTAYDHHALEAFRNNGIDYVLKPFRKEDLHRAVVKWRGLRSPAMQDVQEKLGSMSALRQEPRGTASVLVNWKDRIIPLKIAEIAFFGLLNGNTFLVTMDDRRFLLQDSLEDYMQRCGAGFFRVNRQFLVNRDAVVEAVHHSNRKLLVRLRPDAGTEITIAKARVPEFLHWLES